MVQPLVSADHTTARLQPYLSTRPLSGVSSVAPSSTGMRQLADPAPARRKTRGGDNGVAAPVTRRPARLVPPVRRLSLDTPGYDTGGGCGPLVLRHHQVETRKGD